MTLRNKTRELLLWTQKFTKTDMLYAAHGGVWSLAGQASNIVLTFLLALALGNWLVPAAYGQYKYVLSLAGLLSALSLTGSNTAVTQSVARGFEGMFKKIVFMNLRWGPVLLLSGWLGAAYYFAQSNYLLAAALAIIAVVIPLLESVNFYPYFLIGRKLLREKTLYEVLVKIVYVVAMLVTALLTSNILLLVIVHFGTALITTSLAYAWTIFKHRPNNLIDPAATAYVKHLSFMNALVTVAEQLDGVLLFHFLGPAAVAVYVFSQVPIDQLTALIRTPLIHLMTPKLAEKNLALFKHALLQKALRLLALLIPVVVIAAAAAPFFFRWLFPQYVTAIPYTQVYALVLLFIPFIFFTEALKMHARKRELYLFHVIVPPAKIILLLTLLPLYGIWGALLAIFITKFVNLFVLIYVFRKI